MNISILRLVRRLCGVLPPIFAQQIREWLMSYKDAEELAFELKSKSFTGGYLRNNTIDFHAFRFFIHGYFDWRNIVLAKKILQIKNGDFVEVGANIGTETVSLAAINTHNNVHAFEPLPKNYQQLEQIRIDNGFKNLKNYNVLVSDKSGRADFRIPRLNQSGSGYIIKQSVEIEDKLNFEVVTLDEKLNNLQSCSAILVDVEGFEYQVLCGARKIISRFRPFVIIEVNKNFLEDRAGITVPFLHQYLEEAGYRSFYIQKMGIKEVNLQNFEVVANKNWLCIPKEKLKYKRFLSRSIYLNALNPLIAKRIF